MPKHTYIEIKQLSERHAIYVSSAPQVWTDYLDTAARLYRYDFGDTLLIHAQRPQATACAEMRLWNDRMGRWINRGSNGIALLVNREDNGRGGRLRYVFDIEDTHMVRNGKTPFLWQIAPNWIPQLVEYLIDAYDLDISEGISLNTALVQIAEQMTDEMEEEAFLRFDDNITQSRLAQIDDDALREQFHRLYLNTTIYVLSRRCGLDPNDVLAEDAFAGISDFNTHAVLSVLGNGVHEITEPVLRDIGRVLAQYSVQEYRENQRKALENSFDTEYNALKRESDVLQEGDKEHGEETGSGEERRERPDLSLGGGLPDPGSDGRAGAGDPVGSVRQDEEQLFDGQSQFVAQEHDDLGNAQQGSSESGQGSIGDDGETGRSDEEEGRRDRAAESGQLAGVGPEDGQHSEQSGGIRPPGDRLQVLEEEGIRVEEIADEAEDDETSAFSLSGFSSPEEQINRIEENQREEGSLFTVPYRIVDHVLRAGPGGESSLLRVIYNYMIDGDESQRADFLKEIYKTGYKGLIIDGQQYAVSFDATGISIAEGDSVRIDDFFATKSHLSWEEASGRINAMIENGSFAPQILLDLAKDRVVRITSQNLVYMFMDLDPDVRSVVLEGTGLEEVNTLSFPDAVDRYSDYLSDEEHAKIMVQRLEDLARAHEENPQIMRSRFHPPKDELKMVRRIAVPARALSDDGQVKALEDEFFITEDEIDTYLRGGTPYTDGDLSVYAYFLSHSDVKERAHFLKEQHGIGGRTNALSGEDASYADYSGKGVELSRRGAASVTLTWTNAAKRIGQMIEEDRYLTTSAMKRMPSYERRRMGDLVIRFYDRLSGDIDRPFENSAVFSVSDRNTLYAQIEEPAFLDDLLERMDSILASLPFDHADYDAKADALGTLHAWVDGAYTIFPGRERQTAAESGSQLNMFDLVSPEIVGEQREETPAAEESAVSEIVDDAAQTEEDDFSDIDPDSIREGLAANGIVGGEVVDPQALEQDPFIQQVADAVEDQAGDTVSEESNTDEVSDLPDIETEIGPVSEQEAEPDEERINFHITEDTLGEGGPKASFRANVEAIRLLKRLEEEGVRATPSQQEVLSRYVGWGGIPQAFDEDAKGWEEEAREIRGLLTDKEYTDARASTLSAFYTPPAVIRAMYNVLSNMGFDGGNVLEPSCGTGNFMGMLPQSMEDSHMYGVELDSISGRIAQQLYQKNHIAVRGFEESEFPDSFFDLVVGNVPFGQFSVPDKRYDRHHFLIHDYFIGRSLDLVRPGGVVAVITASGTMDKKNEDARKYIAERADLLGAIRLPDNAFRKNANTDVVADILFLQKRDRKPAELPDWVHLKETEDGYTLNSYFADHPEMVLGDLAMESTQYGRDQLTVKPYEGADLAQLLSEAAGRIQGEYQQMIVTDSELEEEEDVTIPADPDVRNYSFTQIDGEVYFRENSVMIKQVLPKATTERILGMIELRDTVRELLDLQVENASDEDITPVQEQLNQQYDAFTKKNGLLSASANKKAFQADSSYSLLASLEIIDENGKLERKADLFTKRTIRAVTPVTSVDTSSEALAVSIGEKAGVDLPYMMQLTGKSEEEIVSDLQGVIFLNPMTEQYETADEYLSGNIRDKLRIANRVAEDDDSYAVNVKYLESVMPKELDASQIEVRLGAPWIKTEYIEQFMADTFGTPRYLLGSHIKVQYAQINGQWNITGKNRDNFGNSLVTSTYGTERVNAYRLLEDALNLRDTKIYDTEDVIVDGESKERRVLNKKETILAQQRQELIKEAFREWIFQDMERREDICKTYNELFNSTRPREYDGQHIVFGGMSPEIDLMTHQRNAVARMLYGKNTLLAHCVGAGKTYQMVAAGMESRRLGLAQKNLYVVPNHLTEQWGSEFLRLYPGANILVATKKDFEPANRKKFCSRIATGDYDAIIIGHSQFERIPLSKERQVASLERQLEGIRTGIMELSEQEGARYTIKQMEKTMKTLQAKLIRLNDQSRKDDVVTFEQLGVDRLFVDESHNYKNLFLFTKMRNVAGIQQTNAQKSSDMLMKCQYMDEITGGKGVTFATGTPISNSMVELYTIMRYLQQDTLHQLRLEHFDSWAASFGETVNAIELSPEGYTLVGR